MDVLSVVTGQRPVKETENCVSSVPSRLRIVFLWETSDDKDLKFEEIEVSHTLGGVGEQTLGSMVRDVVVADFRFGDQGTQRTRSVSLGHLDPSRSLTTPPAPPWCWTGS